MSYAIPEVVLEKPSRILNFTFVVFGYVLSSYLISPLDIIFEQKISSVLILGAALGTFLYYLNPVERGIAFYLLIRGFDKMTFESEFGALNYSRTEALNSPLLKEELAKITGAVFLFVSLLLSGNLLLLVNISLPLWILIALALPILSIAVWETRVLLREKMDYILWYYYFVIFERPFASEILKAIEAKDWIGAHNIVNRILMKRSIYVASGGVCPKCEKILPPASFCTECGTPLVTYCSECKAAIVREGTTKVPVYCYRCGKKLKYPKDTPS